MFQPVGTHQDLIKHPDVAARLDGVDEMRQHVLSRIHDNIVTPKGCSLRITVPAWSNPRPQLCIPLRLCASAVQSPCLSSPRLSQRLRGSASNPRPQLCFLLYFSASLRLGVQSAFLSTPRVSQRLRGSASNPVRNFVVSCIPLRLCASAVQSAFLSSPRLPPRLRGSASNPRPQLCFSLVLPG